MGRAAKAGVWAGAGAAVLGLAGYWYAHRIERVHVSLERATVEVDKPGLPPDGLTILHLSDFHFRANDRVQDVRLQRLRALLASEHYDILAFTGDLIHDEAGLPAALAFLAELHPAIAAFSVPGNRDYWESSFKALLGTSDERAALTVREKMRLVLRNLRRMLRTFAGNERAVLKMHHNDVPAMHAALQAQGIEPLLNCAINVRGPDYDLWFAGIDDLTHGKPNLAAALSPVPRGAVLVLLAHNPDVWLDETNGAPDGTRAGSRRADLILSGHTHGGQLNLPVVGAWYRQGTHVSRQKAAGWFAAGPSRMYVSRGLGESFPFRFRAPPQAALIRLIRLGHATQQPG
jgi:predicted MPP superfamily phosphohydrolase